MEQINNIINGQVGDVEVDLAPAAQVEVDLTPVAQGGKKVRKPRTKAVVTESVSGISTSLSQIQIENKPKKRIVSVPETVSSISWPINLTNSSIVETLDYLTNYNMSNELRPMILDYVQIVKSGNYDNLRMNNFFTSLIQYYRRLVAVILFNQSKSHDTSSDCAGLKTFLDTVCYENKLILEYGKISCVMKNNSLSTIHNKETVGEFCFFQDLPAMKSVELIQPNISSIITDLYVIWCLCIINIYVLTNSDYNASLFPTKITKSKDGSENETQKDMNKMFMEKILLLANDTAQPLTKPLFGSVARKKKVTPKAGNNADVSIPDALAASSIRDMIGQSLEDSQDIIVQDDEDESDMNQ